MKKLFIGLLAALMCVTATASPELSQELIERYGIYRDYRCGDYGSEPYLRILVYDNSLANIRTGHVIIGDLYVFATAKQQGLDYRVDWDASAARGAALYALVIKNNGSAFYYDFSLEDTATASRTLTCTLSL